SALIEQYRARAAQEGEGRVDERSRKREKEAVKRLVRRWYGLRKGIVCRLCAGSGAVLCRRCQDWSPERRKKCRSCRGAAEVTCGGCKGGGINAKAHGALAYDSLVWDYRRVHKRKPHLSRLLAAHRGEPLSRPVLALYQYLAWTFQPIARHGVIRVHLTESLDEAAVLCEAHTPQGESAEESFDVVKDRAGWALAPPPPALRQLDPTFEEALAAWRAMARARASCREAVVLGDMTYGLGQGTENAAKNHLVERNYEAATEDFRDAEKLYRKAAAQ
ncbi:hypothetical protein ACFL59_10815, partial [Planctomycetota bacterium]